LEILTRLQREILKSFVSLTDHDAFYLTGGTALSAFFLQHRRSRDLDFFTSSEELIPSFSQKLEAVLVKNKFKVSRLRGFQSFIEIDVNSAEEQTLVHFALDSPFRFEPPTFTDQISGLKIDSLIDMATNKLLALFGRAALRDFVDVYFLIREQFTKDQLLAKCRLKDPGFDLYWLGVAMEKVEEFEDDDADLHLVVRSIRMNDLREFYRFWRQEIQRVLGSG
jgi:predicted nucleotidyltransferase component of viral defense system